MTDIGRVGMVTKGEFNSASAYEKLDVVTFNSATYIAKKDVPAGITPANTTYWQEALSNAIIGNTSLPAGETLTSIAAKTYEALHVYRTIVNDIAQINPGERGGTEIPFNLSRTIYAVVAVDSSGAKPIIVNNYWADGSVAHIGLYNPGAIAIPANQNILIDILYIK